MNIVSEVQLRVIKNEYSDLINDQLKKYVFEGDRRDIFENLIVFSDEVIYNSIRKDHYLSMTNCNRIWNEYFWYLRYQSDIELNGGNALGHEQPIFRTLEKLYNSCNSIDDNLIEPFSIFAKEYQSQEYVIFDYFHPAITETGVSIQSNELKEIIELLEIENFSFEKLDELIEKNIDNSNGELLTYYNSTDKKSHIKIDTYTASVDQIHPIDLLIKCPKMYEAKVDELLTRWWKQFWNRMGPFVSVSIVDKFETNERYINRKRIKK